MALFYGWRISVLSMGGNFMLQGAGLYCMNAFMEPLCELHGWTRMGLNFSLGLATLMGQIAMPIAAAIATKVSLRLLMGLGALVGGLATCAMGLTSELWLFTVYNVILWIASQFCGGVVGNALMSNWFSHYRGIAFGIANSGTSLSGMLLPMAVLVIINTFNVPVAYMTLGVVTCALAPLCWWIVRRTPAMLHMHPDGRKHEPHKAIMRKVNTHGMHLFRRPAVWYIGMSFGLALMAAAAVLSQMKPRFSDLGLGAYAAMFLAAFSAFAGTVAKYVWGWLCDRFTPIFAARLLMMTCLLSMGLMFAPSSLWIMIGFALFFAFGAGGLWVVLPAVTAYYFGAPNFLGVYKIISIFIIIRCLGFPVMGLSHELAGSYILADIIFAISYLAAFILTMLLHPERAVEKDRHHKKTHKIHKNNKINHTSQ